MRRGSRPAPVAASSITRLPSASHWYVTPGRRDGTHPSALRPIRSSILGLYAPTQIPMSCAGRGPVLTPASR